MKRRLKTNGSGKIDYIIYPNGLKSDYTYNSVNNLESIEITKGDTVIRTITYSYDKGKITGKTDSVTGSGLTSYVSSESYENDTLDNLKKVTQTMSNNSTIVHDFDYNEGFFLTEHKVDNVIKYQYAPVGTNSNRLNTVGIDSNNDGTISSSETKAISYNSSLRPSRYDSKTRAFDFFGNLTQLGNKTYTYDHNHRRIKETDSQTGETKHLIYDQFDRLIAEADVNGNYTTTYIWGPSNLLLGKIEDQGTASEEVIYFTNDYLGNNVITTDGDGNVLSQNQYSAWGEPTQVYGNTEEANFIFTGKHYDEYTRSYNLGKRVYMPELKRFLSDDAVNPQLDNFKSFNAYVYANNDPVNFWDPDGNEPISITILGISALANFGIDYYSQWKQSGMSFKDYYWSGSYSPMRAAGQMTVGAGTAYLGGAIGAAKIGWIAKSGLMSGMTMSTYSADKYFKGETITKEGLLISGGLGIVSLGLGTVADKTIRGTMNLLGKSAIQTNYSFPNVLTRSITDNLYQGIKSISYTAPYELSTAATNSSYSLLEQKIMFYLNDGMGSYDGSN